MFSRIREDISCVFTRDPAARNVFEVLTTYPGIHAVMFHRASHWLWTHKVRWIARVLSNFARWMTGIEIHPGATIGRRFFIDHGMGVVIGETAEIGDDCTLYHGVTLGGTSWDAGKRHPTLGDDVVVGAGAKVLGPICLGNGARVGSNAVVVKAVPENATVIGVPGHLVGLHAETSPEREAIAKKIGFDAYGTSPDMPDPVAHAINHMLDHIHLLDERMEMMSEKLQDIGVDSSQAKIPEMECCEIISGADDLSNASSTGEDKQGY
ncbi:serine O-acetyltransferase [Pseudomonadota bacterium]